MDKTSLVPIGYLIEMTAAAPPHQLLLMGVTYHLLCLYLCILEIWSVAILKVAAPSYPAYVTIYLHGSYQSETALVVN